ncbi:hypothetical protein CY34DRAFT_776674 [Suillus luteus UH-Slu-Lm8-n1]|uniref:Unplaced genomic scaffold CY34scaffold_34, whole genome shotgun sequence n=1 Tax=Suillus luteus UH-Slu-Lm8-n1 TaxID=930992 RepID=A0A0D0AW83_9AGAM|nr:hypothetical protein CY34DRAFT_776674 [Suillus luteus UH-Slu-Lm8-n1]
MPSQPPFEIHPGNFSLNVSGVAGFFGGDEAISAIQTIHHYKARRFLGWYNSPGSWNVGKKFGKLAKSRFWDGLFPGPDEEPAKFFELDGKQGPKYVASRSGSILEHTGHLAYLIMQKSKEELGKQVKGRITKRNKVTIIKTQLEPVREIPPRRGHHTLVAILPIAVSFTACALCGWTNDWFCFSMILLGIVSSGVSSLVIGSARLKLQGVNSAPTAPPGDGMLMDGDDIVLLLGKEEDVATITRGKFILEYDPWYAAIGLCSLLLVIQLLGQLLLIPQGTLFGQIMFLSSFAASWTYNLYLSSIDNEYIQERLILKELHLEQKHMQTYVFGTRTTAAVFACLMLQPFDKVTHKYVAAAKWKDLGFEPESIIRNFIPNDTQVWVTWRKKVLEVMRTRDGSQDTCHGLLQMSSEDKMKFEPADKQLLRWLLKDARIAYNLAMIEQGWLKED